MHPQNITEARQVVSKTAGQDSRAENVRRASSKHRLPNIILVSSLNIMHDQLFVKVT
jgi:hypothetical protein